MQGKTSKLLDNAVEQFALLPGIGKKSALRLVLHLLKQPVENVEIFSSAITELRSKVHYCKICNMISDSDICAICSDTHRDASLICVVESIRDVLSIEATDRYNGLYHVLGGIISPLDGIGPSDLPIDELIERVKGGGIKEVILALSTSTDGETTAFYLYKKLKDFNITLSAIARGVAFGDDLEYTDELTLAKSIENRQPYKL